LTRDQRRLAAIVSADVVGYSRLMGRDESGTLATLKAHRRELIDLKIAEYGGRIVKTTGDGLLLEFASVVDAVRCAVDVQRGMAERNVDVPADRRIEFRIGINVGDIIVDDGDIFGDGVNVAARLQTLAQPGRICVSRGVRGYVLDKLHFGFESLGSQTVKNIARPLEVYCVRDDARQDAAAEDSATLPAPTPSPLGRPRTKGRAWAIAATALIIGVALAWSVPQLIRPAQELAPPISVAILPFSAPEGTPSDTRDADTLARDVATALSQWRWAAVVPPGSSSPAGDARSVGKALNVRYVANGDVRQVGDRKVVTVHLIDAATGATAWSDRLEFAAGSSLEPQSAPATRVSRRLRSALYDAEIRRASANPIAGNAWDVVLRGDATLATQYNDLATVRAARKQYEQALRIDPNFVPALVSIVMTNFNLTTNDLDLDPAEFTRLVDESDKITARAVTIDSKDSSAWFQRSQALGMLGRWDEALSSNERGAAIDPFNPLLVMDRAIIMLAMDRPEDALSLAQRALTLERGLLGEEGASVRTLCWSHMMLGHYADAVRACERAVVTENWWLDHAFLAAGYAQKGDTARATAAKLELLKQRPSFTIAKLKATDPATRNAGYAARAEAHLYAGLRKAGIADQ